MDLPGEETEETEVKEEGDDAQLPVLDPALEAQVRADILFISAREPTDRDSFSSGSISLLYELLLLLLSAYFVIKLYIDTLNVSTFSSVITLMW